MSRRAAAAVVLLSFLPPSLSAQEPVDHPWCGTTPEIRERAKELASWARVAQRHKAVAPAAIRRNGNVLVLPPDEEIAPFGHRADLENLSLDFERTGETTYRSRSGPLQYDSNIGTIARTFADSDPNEFASYNVQRFAIPFGSRSVRTLYISERFGIFLAPPAASSGQQLWPIDSAVMREAVIAPYLQPVPPRTLRFARRDLHIRETDDRVVITWVGRYEEGRALDPLNDAVLDLQVVIERNGDIRFSYRRIHNLGWGAVMVTTGDSPQLQQIASADDPAGDVDASRPGANLIDIRRVEVLRAGTSELLSIRLKLGGSIRPPSGVSVVTINAVFSGPSGNVGSFTLLSDRTLWRYCSPGGICRTSGSAAEFASDEVTLHLLDRQLAQAGDLNLRVTASVPGGASDNATLPLNVARGVAVETDLSALGSDRQLSLPLLEVFTLPVLDVETVWTRIRDELGLWDEEVDGVAIFQNFETDIMQFATAYSTVGNSGADGVWAESEEFYGAAVPRSPALLHMNRIIEGDAGASRLNFRHFLTAHEFGHRWLYGFTIRENGQHTWVLNPGGGHPAQYVHTPAAFQVFTPTDYSVMGGSNFRQLSETTFATPPSAGAWGYSWHELYLMGLAAPSEVPDWFYIADSDPRLGDAYNPAPNLTVSGRRVNVTFPQLTDSMGARFPEMQKSANTFRLLFVFLEEPSAVNAAEEALLLEAANSFPQYFGIATGGRGSILSALPERPVAKLQLPARAFTGSNTSFRDQSTELPARWLWSFGDGTTSTEQHPEHAYRNPGTYVVTLTVSNSRGSSVDSGEIVVERGMRRRPAR